MAKLHSSLCAFAAVSLSAALAQEPAPKVSPAPIDPPRLVAVPAPIAPPINTPAVPVQVAPAGVTTTTLVTDPALPIPGAPTALAPSTSRLSDFQGDPIDLVLRTLARQAKMNIVVSDSVTTTAGTVNMRIEDKTPREAIEVIVTAKGLIMDEQKGVFFIKTLAEKAKEPTESGSFVLNYAQAKDVAPLLQGQLASAVPPQFDVRTNTIFYRENRSNLDKIALFLESIDKPTQQVMIEARLVEVTANPKQAYGLNWGGVLGSSGAAQTLRYGGSLVTQQSTTTGANSSTGGSIGGVPNPVNTNISGGTTTTSSNTVGLGDFFRGGSGSNILGAVAGQFAILSAPQMSLTLRLLNEDSDAEFLANPRVVTANNMKAEIKITRNQPVPQLTFNEQTAQAVFSGFQDKEYGNTLVVTPSINKDQFVTLNVQPEISNKVGDATFAFGGATVTSPVIDKRTLNSNVLIKSGDTLAIGGLLQDEQTKGRTKVPILGDIPVLGYLFQEKIAQRSKRNLLVFVTPTVIKQGYGTGLEDQASGLAHTGDEYADPNGWRNNAKGARRIVPTSNRPLAADYPKPGVPKQPRKTSYKVTASPR